MLHPKRLPCALATSLWVLHSIGWGATLNAVYNSATDVPLTVSGYTATGNTVNFTLNFAPSVGTDLMVVNNTGLGFISGTFDNLGQGEPVALTFSGVTYGFVANYYGGKGNDLVLIWANSRALAWGYNDGGQVGDHTLFNRTAPVSVDTVSPPSVLFGQTVLRLAGGDHHSLGLRSDGLLAAWGDDQGGQLGFTNQGPLNQTVPVLVNTNSGASALYGKAVIAMAAGVQFSLALCSDGTLAGCGVDDSGQLGDNGMAPGWSQLPIAVNTSSGVSALYGKKPVAVAAGMSHGLALCSDGTVVAWGDNAYGQLGDNTVTTRLAPVAVNTTLGLSALAGKTVIAIAAGDEHSLALCSDGTVAAWGWNAYDQLGDGTNLNSPVPVLVNTTSGLYGKTVVAISAAGRHSLALCSDGSIAAWGWNTYGQLGDDTTVNRNVPVLVNTNSGVSSLYGKSVTAIAANATHNLALCSDGTLAAWGWNYYGQLGDGTTTQRNAPVPVRTSALAQGQRFTRIAQGTGFHSLAAVAAPDAVPFTLSGSAKVTNGGFLFGFTNTPGAFFGVLATTNPAAPLSHWTAVNGPQEISPGQYSFTDPQATNFPHRFYRVQSP